MMEGFACRLNLHDKPHGKPLGKPELIAAANDWTDGPRLP
jgi:hypothetical protein